MKNKKFSVFKTAVFMVAATLLSKVFGMLRDILLASNYGTSYEAIAYETASRLPLLLFDFVMGGVVTASFIPIFNEILVKKDKKEALQFANQYVNLILVLTLAMSVIGVAFSGTLVNFLAPSITEEAHSLAVSLSRIMFPMIIFTGLAFSFVGILQSFGEYNIPSAISIVSNGIIVVYFIFFNKYFGIYGLAAAMLIGWIMQAAVQIPSVRKFGYSYSLSFDFRSEYIKRALKMALPILISTWVQPVCTLINTRLASSLENGRAIIAISYSNRLNIIIVGVFSFVATNLIFPMISRATTSGDKKETEKLTNISLKLLLLVIIPISFGAIILAEPIISLIYGRGEFSADDVKLTAEALRYLAIGMPFMAVNEVLTKLFFAKQETKLPMTSALISMAANFVAAYVLSGFFGLAGIAVSSSIAIGINMAINYAFLKKKGEALFSAGDFADVVKIILSAALMSAAVWFVKSKAVSDASFLVSLAVSVVVGIIVYAICIVILGYRKYKDLLKEQIFTKNKM